jgi:BlaI family transcriptional regulator, penicillinase repressor
MAQLRARPTDAELAILHVLWDRGPSTVRQVFESLADRETGYTTTLKLMQIMSEKGLVRRDETARTHVYAAAVSRDKTQQHLVRDLLDRAFGGSAASLVMQALSSHPTSPEERREIEQLIAEYRNQHRATNKGKPR